MCLATASVAWACSPDEAIKNDNNGNTVLPPEYSAIPDGQGGQVTSNALGYSPCSGYQEVKYGPSGDGYQPIHKAFLFCAAVAEISCTTTIRDFVTVFDTLTRFGNPCNAERAAAERLYAGHTFLHTVDFTISLAPPLKWQGTTLLCNRLISPTVVACHDDSLQTVAAYSKSTYH